MGLAEPEGGLKDISCRDMLRELDNAGRICGYRIIGLMFIILKMQEQEIPYITEKHFLLINILRHIPG